LEGRVVDEGDDAAAEPDYAAVSEKLDKYSAGHLTAEQVLPSPCDAEAIAP